MPHGSYVRNIHNCNLECLDSDAFDFPGASSVTAVNIKYNNFLALPEKLLWNLTSLLQFVAENLAALQTLPEKFFLGQSNLQTIQFGASTNLGAQQRLPEKLFKGLTSLAQLELTDCKVQNMPMMDDLKVGALIVGGCLPCRRRVSERTAGGGCLKATRGIVFLSFGLHRRAHETASITLTLWAC